MDVDKDLAKEMGFPKIWQGEEHVKGEDVKDPVIVAGGDENIELSKEELDVLRLGPKFCLYAKKKCLKRTWRRL